MGSRSSFTVYILRTVNNTAHTKPILSVSAPLAQCTLHFDWSFSQRVNHATRLGKQSINHPVSSSP
jgi:hypothetical protein